MFHTCLGFGFGQFLTHGGCRVCHHLTPAQPVLLHQGGQTTAQSLGSTECHYQHTGMQHMSLIHHLLLPLGKYLPAEI